MTGRRLPNFVCEISSHGTQIGRRPRLGCWSARRAVERSDWTWYKENMFSVQCADPEAEVGYIINVPLSQRQGTVVIETRQRQLTPEGFTAWKPWRINRATVARLPEPVDRQIAAMLLGASAKYSK